MMIMLCQHIIDKTGSYVTVTVCNVISVHMIIVCSMIEDVMTNRGIKYPLPNGRAVSNKIGKGGNGFVFTMYVRIMHA